MHIGPISWVLVASIIEKQAYDDQEGMIDLHAHFANNITSRCVYHHYQYDITYDFCDVQMDMAKYASKIIHVCCYLWELVGWF